MTETAGAAPSFWILGAFLTTAATCIWLVRILVKLLLSQIHLKTDAAEKRVMIHTYLALLREGEPFKPEEKKLMLEQIFKSASDGIVKDDAAPSGLLGLLTPK